MSILYHRDDRKKSNYHSQSFVLCRIDRQMKSIDKDEIFVQSCRGGFLHWCGSLKSGYYLLIPFSISFWKKNFNDKNSMKRTFTLVIHSTIQLNGIFIHEPATVLAHCLINAIIKSCQKPDQVSANSSRNSLKKIIFFLFFQRMNILDFL